MSASDVKKEEVKGFYNEYGQKEETHWQQNPQLNTYTPTAKTEEHSGEPARFFCAVCDHSAYSIEVSSKFSNRF